MTAISLANEAKVFNKSEFQGLQCVNRESVTRQVPCPDLKKHGCPSSSSSIIPDQLEHIENNYMYTFDFEGLVQRKDEDKVYEAGTVGRMLKGGRAGR